MNELVIHLRKDVKLLTSDSLFVIFLVMIGIISFIIALTTCTSYVQTNSYGPSVVTKASLEAAQASALISYWGTAGGLLMALFIGAAAIAMGAEKESGMGRYTLSHKVRGTTLYLSKLIVVLAMVTIAMVIALMAYLIVFSFMDVPMLDLGRLAASMVFPFLSILVFSSLGLAISTMGSKKGAMVAVAIMVFFILSVIFPISISMGAVAAMRADPTLTYDNYTEALPMEYQLLIYGNPMVLTYGSNYMMGGTGGSAQLFDTAGGVMLAAGFFVAFTALGLALMSRERLERPWSESARRLLGRLRRAQRSK